MTYQPRSEAAKMYQQGAAKTLGAIAKPAMPVIDAWQRGVDIAGVIVRWRVRHCKRYLLQR